MTENNPATTRIAIVLTLDHITLRIGQPPAAHTLLREVSLQFRTKHLAAIVGPSGCGKTTLLKVIAGLYEANEGGIHWHGRDLSVMDLPPGEIGYVPQFGMAYPQLTVAESVEAAIRLRVSGLASGQRKARTQRILWEVGLHEIGPRRVGVLSGGEKRRLALALEMVSSPSLMLCDEATAGLDPKAEEEIVTLMHRLSREHHRIVLTVTHSFRHLPLYDSIVVMHQGCIVYHGPTDALTQHFSVRTPEEIFPLLATRPAEEWAADWKKEHPEPPVVVSRDETLAPEAEPEPSPDPDAILPLSDAEIPGALTQFRVLLGRRWRIFVRSYGQFWLQLGLMFGFPFLVVIFALHGLPQIKNLTMELDVGVLQQLRETNEYIIQTTNVGRLVSGLVMFQVILLTLTGSNNASREVASERLILEKEKLAGLRPTSYLASKAAFLFVLVAAQSVWMAVFVRAVCQFPGDLWTQTLMLVLVNGAMTAVSLGISSLMRSPEQASLVSIYLVGFQLPLSGAVLALPGFLSVVTQPFIAAYWSWSGILHTMRETRFYDAVQAVTETDLMPIPLCLWALGAHIILGFAVAYLGCKHSRWE
jgi:ABC-type multidrug transport system ATPase subunit